MELKLKSCNIKKCEAMCCHDGVYLMEGEDLLLFDLVKLVPKIQDALPKEYIVDGYWRGEYYGKKTAVREYYYKDTNYPKHFPQTRCVFADCDGLCILQKLAVEKGLHPWTFKPSACWLFPLHKKDDILIAPPIHKKDDVHCYDDYAGFVSYTHCGRHDSKGEHWEDVLFCELGYYRSKGAPVLNTCNHTARILLNMV